MDTSGAYQRAPDEPVATAARMSVALGSGIVMEADDAMAELVGCPAAQLVGRPLGDLWPEPERAAVAARFDDVVLLGRDRFGALALCCARGAPAWVEVDAHFDYQGVERLEIALLPLARPVAPAVPAAGPEGSARDGPAAPAEDDSAREPDVATGETHAMVLAALEATGAAVLFVDAAGRVAGGTQAVERMLGRSAAALRGPDLREIVALPEAAEQALAAAWARGQRQTVLGSPADGEGQLVVEWVPGLEVGSGYAVLSGPDRRVSGHTEQLRLQAQLVSHVSHDLRGALAAAYCGLRTLVEDLAADAPVHETAVQSLAQVQRATRIVDEVLALSRPGRLRRAEVSLADLVRSVVERCREQAAAQGVTVALALADDLRVSADPSSLERALGNLVENALRAMAGGGELSVTLEQKERLVAGALVAVADSGIGIRPELQATVFEPFVSDSAGGSGLGLTITRHIVLAHGGQIDFDSEPGRGTTFRVWLPRLA